MTWVSRLLSPQIGIRLPSIVFDCFFLQLPTLITAEKEGGMSYASCKTNKQTIVIDPIPRHFHSELCITTPTRVPNRDTCKRAFPREQTLTRRIPSAKDHFPRKKNTHEKNEKCKRLLPLKKNTSKKNAKCKRPLPLRTNTSKKNTKCKRPLIPRKQNIPKKNAKSKGPLHSP
jgi:hypothetical protein